MHLNISRQLLKILIFLSFVVATPQELCASAAHKENPIISASELDYPPYCVVNAEQQADGFSVELLRAVLHEVGREVIFTTGPWNEVKQSLIDGSVQVLPLVGRTPEREAVFDFTFPYLTMHGTIVVRKDEKRIATLEDLHGKKVAVMRGDNAEEFVRRVDLSPMIATTDTFLAALTGLEQGDYDAVIIQKLLYLQLAKEYGLNQLKAVGKPLDDFKQTFCFAVKKGDRETLQMLNEGLSIVFTNGTFEHLYRKWIIPAEHLRAEKSRIVVGGDSNYPPYEYLDENGQPAGYNVELTRKIAEQIGLTVDIQLKPWQQVREELSSGEIDLVHGMFYSPERDATFDFSPAHTRISHVAVVKRSHPIPKGLSDLNGKSVVVMAGDIMHDLLVTHGKARKIVTAASQEEALRLFREGDYDCALTARLPALYWIKKHGWKDLAVGKTSLVSLEYCYATLHDQQDLLERFSEGLASLQASGEFRKIYAETLGHYEQPPFPYLKHFIAVVGSLACLLLISLFALKVLNRKVRERTAELESESAERKKLLETISEREKTINLILNSTAEGIYGVNKDGECTFFNSAAQKLLGYDEREMIGRVIHDLIAHTTADGNVRTQKTCLLAGVINHGVPHHDDDGILWKKDGDWLNVAFHAHPILKDGQADGAVVTFTDISDKKKLIEQRIRAGQLSSLGELAAGVAHEINNPITGVINYAQILLNKHPDNDFQKKILDNIIKEGNRIALIVRNLLKFSHKDRDLMEPIPVEMVVHEAIELLQQQLKIDGIFLDIDLEDDLPKIYGNAQKLEQVILNLASNARHALNDRYPGPDPNKILRISAQKVGQDADTRIELVVWDQGRGICQENMQRIFNRFFTTKPAGVGTGLGLSIVHTILEEHGARIDIESEVDLFTKVTIEFPVVAGDGATRERPLTAARH